LKKIAAFMIIMFLTMGLAPAQAQSNDESYVIGRLTGVQRELPGYFKNNSRLQARGIDRVEVPGFRLLREVDGKKFLIRPNHEGFFYQALPGGKYTFARKRNDRPDYRQSKNIKIMNFEVEPGALVNLGTINIVLKGEPDESLFHLGDTAKGKYIYRYHYERDHAENAYNNPLNWFTGKKQAVSASLREKIVRENAEITGEQDSSRVVLREVRPFGDK